MIYSTIDDDAATLYESTDWKRVDLSDGFHAYRPPDPSAREGIDRELEANRKPLERLARAARSARCGWSRSQEDLFDDLPSVFGFAKAGHLLRTRVLRQLEEGREREAAETLAEGLKVGTDYLNHPQMIGKLVGCVVIMLMSEAFQIASKDFPFDGPELEFLERHLAYLPDRLPGMEGALEEERQCAVASINTMLSLGFAKAVQRLQGIPSNLPRESELGELLQPILDRDREASRMAIAKAVNDSFSLMAQDALRPLNSGPPRFNRTEFNDRIKADAAEWMISSVRDPRRDLDVASRLSAILFLPQHLKHREILALARLSIEAAGLWIRLKRKQSEAGAYPKTLEGMAGVPRDPFDGGPIKYRRISKGSGDIFVLTASGPAEDWEGRILDLEKCLFNLVEFRKLSDAHDRAADYTWIGSAAPAK